MFEKIETWEEAEKLGIVRLRVLPDECMYDDSYIDTWTDMTPEERAAEKAALWDRIAAEGVWGIEGDFVLPECPCCGHGGTWEHANSVWGFIGEDWRDSGYDADIKASTLDALNTARAKCAVGARALASDSYVSRASRA